MAGTTKKQTGKSQGEKSSDSGTDVGATVAETGHQVQEQVLNLGQQVRQQATTQLASQKDRAVDALDTISLLLHQAGEHAHQQDKAMLAQYVDQAASRLDEWTGTLREQDVSEVAQSTTQFARRQPLLFLGAAAAAGFAGVRFLRSTAQAGQESTTGSRNGSETMSATDTMPSFDIDQDMTTSGPTDTITFGGDESAFMGDETSSQSLGGIVEEPVAGGESFDADAVDVLPPNDPDVRETQS